MVSGEKSSLPIEQVAQLQEHMKTCCDQMENNFAYLSTALRGVERSLTKISGVLDSIGDKLGVRLTSPLNYPPRDHSNSSSGHDDIEGTTTGTLDSSGQGNPGNYQGERPTNMSDDYDGDGGGPPQLR